MARLARDTVEHFYPAQLSIMLDGRPVVIGQPMPIAPGVRDAVFEASVVSNGAVHPPPTDALPHSFRWTFFALSGCKHLGFTTPDSPTTRLRVIDPLDRASITLQVITRFETINASFDLEAPPSPANLELTVNGTSVAPAGTVVLPSTTTSVYLSAILRSLNLAYPMPPGAVFSWAVTPIVGMSSAVVLDPGSAETELTLLTAGDQGLIQFTYTTPFETVSETLTLEIAP